jgi:hypothetical protein
MAATAPHPTATTLVAADVALRTEPTGEKSLISYTPEGVRVLARTTDPAALWAALDELDAPLAA